jgi:hemoglobin/transferrin/lactoferrin receptor protein
MRWLPGLTFCLALLLSMPVLGEEPEEPAPAVNAEELEPVVVTVNRAEQAEQELPRSVDIVTRGATGRKGPKSLPDLLDETTGVFVQKTNGGAGAPILRGMIGPENLVTVDGVRFNNSTFRTGPNQYLSLIDPWSLQQVEVLRGPGSVMYGSDAMGGVFNVVTLAPRRLDGRLFGAEGRLSFSSATMPGTGSAQVDLITGPVSTYAGGSLGYFSEIRAGGGEMQALSDYLRGSGRLKSVARLNERWTLTEAAFYTAIEDAGRTDTVNKGDYRFYDNQDLLAYVRAERRGSGLGHRITLNLSYHFTDETVRRYWCGTDDNGVVLDRAACLAAEVDAITKRRNLVDTVHTPGFFATWESRFWDDRLRFLLGTDGYFDFVGSSREDAKASDDWAWKDADRGNFSEGSSYHQMGAFLNGDIAFLRLGDSSFHLNGGVRASYSSAQAPDVPALGEVKYDDFGVVGAAGLSYRLRDRLNAYVDFSQGFRSPNLQETTVLGDTGSTFEVPNDELGPQRSDTVEVGLKVRTRYVQASAAGFGSWIEDAFARDDVPESEWEALGITAESVGDKPVVRRVNADQAFYRGVEGNLSVGPVAGVSVWGNAAWVKGDVTDSDGNEEPARRVPPLFGAAGLRWEDAGLRLHAELFVKWATRQDRLGADDLADLRICEDPDSPGQLLADCNGVAGWTTLNARVGWRPMDRLEANLSLENLTDVNYRHFGSGMDAPGFNAILSVAARY